MPRTHAVLPPSAAERWIACPPSARLNQKLVERFGEDTSEYAADGTKAHELSELKLRLFLKTITRDEYNAGVAKLGDIPTEMERATDYYVDICEEHFYEARHDCPDAEMFVEYRLDISDWVPDSFGTGDCVIVSDTYLEVIDFKYGKGVPVSAVGNPQARCYGLGAIHEFGDFYGFDLVRNTIIQPRIDNISYEELTRDSLLGWGEQLRPRALMASEGKGEFAPGDWCRFCNAKAICVKRISEALKIVEGAGFTSPEVIDDHAVAGLYKVLPLVKDWVKQFEEYVRSQALRGQKIEGFKLVRGRRPPRVFLDQAEVVRILEGHGYGADQYYTPPELKSVSELEKTIGKTEFKTLLGEQVVQGEGALTLVPEDDKREEYASADADFADLL